MNISALLIVLFVAFIEISRGGGLSHHHGHHGQHGHKECHHHHHRHSCQHLPRLPSPSIDVLTSFGQMNHYFVLATDLKCSSFAITKPARGDTCVDGKVYVSPSANDSSPQTVQFKNNNSSQGIITNSKGESQTWYLWQLELTPNDGGFYCSYSCDHHCFQDFMCATNNDVFVPKMLKIVAEAKKVCRGHLIHNANQNCPPAPTQCPAP